jgi:hypothetical protein
MATATRRERVRPGRIVVESSNNAVSSIRDSSVRHAESSPRARRASEAGHRGGRSQAEARRKHGTDRDGSPRRANKERDRDGSPRRASAFPKNANHNNPSPTNRRKSSTDSPLSKRPTFTPKPPVWSASNCGWELYLVWDRVVSQVGGISSYGNPYSDFYRYSIFYQFACVSFLIASLALTSNAALANDLPRFFVKAFCSAPLLYLWVSAFQQRFVYPAYLYDEGCDHLFKEAQGKMRSQYLAGASRSNPPARTKAQDRIRRLVRLTTLLYWPVAIFCLLQGNFSWVDVSLGLFLLVNIFAVQVRWRRR